MGKMADDSVLDALLEKVGTSIRMAACVGEPANITEVNNTLMASVTMGPGDYTIGNGTPNGRATTVASKTDVPVTGSGTQTVDHVSLDDGTTLLYVTTATPQALTNGNQVTFQSWTITVLDPT